MKFIVTGANGFLGKALAARLSQNHEVVGIARTAPTSSHVLIADLSLPQPHLLKHFTGASAIFHCASRVDAGHPYSRYLQDNVVATQNVLDLAHRAHISNFIFTSSPSVVLGNFDVHHADESMPYAANPLSFYAATKAMAEQLVLKRNSSQMRTVALRPHAIVGAGDTHLVPNLIRAAREKRLRKIGRNDVRIDLTHIHSAVDAHLAAFHALENNKASGCAYFISEGAPFSLHQLLEYVAEQCGSTLQKTLPYSLAWAAACVAEKLKNSTTLNRYQVAMLGRSHHFNISKAIRELNFQPRGISQPALLSLISEAAHA